MFAIAVILCSILSFPFSVWSPNFIQANISPVNSNEKRQANRSGKDDFTITEQRINALRWKIMLELSINCHLSIRTWNSANKTNWNHENVWHTYIGKLYHDFVILGGLGNIYFVCSIRFFGLSIAQLNHLIWCWIFALLFLFEIYFNRADNMASKNIHNILLLNITLIFILLVWLAIAINSIL